jgi:hypothetical protein
MFLLQRRPLSGRLPGVAVWAECLEVVNLVGSTDVIWDFVIQHVTSCVEVALIAAPHRAFVRGKQHHDGCLIRSIGATISLSGQHCVPHPHRDARPRTRSGLSLERWLIRIWATVFATTFHVAVCYTVFL